MSTRLLLLTLLPAFAHAQAIAPVLLDSNGPSEATTRRAQKALETALKSLSGASVREAAPFKKGAPRKCAADCAKELVQLAEAPTVAMLELKGSDTRVVFELSVWLDGERVGTRKGETPPDALEASLKVAVEQGLPAWLRRGFGALALAVEGGSVIKVDGRVVETRAGELLAVPAGVHQVDVVFPDGNALLQRVEVPEAGRVPLEVDTPTRFTSRASQGPSALRYGSYGLFMAGAGSVAAGLIAGALSRGAGIGLTACDSPEARACSTLAEAQAAQAQARQFASTGNVLLGVGFSLMALGASLFGVDALLLR